MTMNIWNSVGCARMAENCYAATVARARITRIV